MPTRKTHDEWFNPFPENVKELLVRAFENRPLENLPPQHVGKGPGVYGLFYTGNFRAYENLANDLAITPIYMGKAVIPGGRKGTGRRNSIKHNYVAIRLKEHSNTIKQARNLHLKDFKCKWLLVVPEFTNAAESILIDYYKPIWNRLISGFGIHHPGSGRLKQARSDWDMLHSGRKFAKMLPKGNRIKTISHKIKEHFKK